MEQIIYNIIDLLEKQETHGRKIAKILEINHMTIQRKIKELEKENVIDFRTEGKNKVYFLKKSIEANEYKKITEHKKLIQITKNPQLRRIINELRDKTNNELIILFGSYAKGNFKERSDIDIYVESQNPEIKKELKLISEKLSIKLGKLNKENNLTKEIIKNHTIIQNIERYYQAIK